MYCLQKTVYKKAVSSQRWPRNAPHIGLTWKFSGLPDYAHTLYPPKNPTCLPYRLFIYVHSFSRDFRLQFWVGVANPQYWGRGGRRGSGMVPFERAFVSSYRPSIVTFSLSLRISEILRLLFSSTPLLPYPTSSFPKISSCFPGSRWIAFSLQRAKVSG